MVVSKEFDPLAVQIVKQMHDSEILGFCWNGRKVVFRSGDHVYVKMADNGRPTRGAPACTWADWFAGYRPKGMGKLVDSFNPWPLFDDSQRVQVVLDGGWPFWGPSDGVLLEDWAGGYVPVHALI